jgi:hypothetical protein
VGQALVIEGAQTSLQPVRLVKVRNNYRNHRAI